jgi:hypothetical protein
LTTDRTQTCNTNGTGGGNGANCDVATDPTCVPEPKSCIDASGQPVLAAAERDRSYTLRAAAALRVAIPLFEHVWLDGLASVTYAPFGHYDPYTPDPSLVPPNSPPEKFALPGEPHAAVQLGIGLRVGAP